MKRVLFIILTLIASNLFGWNNVDSILTILNKEIQSRTAWLLLAGLA